MPAPTTARPATALPQPRRLTGLRVLRSPRALGRAVRAEVLPVRRRATLVSAVAVAWCVGWSLRHAVATGAGADRTLWLGVVPALLVVAVASGPLAVIDARTHRLPDVLTVPSTLVCTALLAAAAAATGDGHALLRAVAGAVASSAAHLLLAWAGGLGLGDVKLAGLIALPLAWLGWDVLALGALGAFVLGGVWSLALLLAGRVGRRSTVALGPFMLAGAGLAVALGA